MVKKWRESYSYTWHNIDRLGESAQFVGVGKLGKGQAHRCTNRQCNKLLGKGDLIVYDDFRGYCKKCGITRTAVVIAKFCPYLHEWDKSDIDQRFSKCSCCPATRLTPNAAQKSHYRAKIG